MTNGMGLDGAPVKFFTLVFLRPPTDYFAMFLRGSTITNDYFRWLSIIGPIVQAVKSPSDCNIIGDSYTGAANIFDSQEWRYIEIDTSHHL